MELFGSVYEPRALILDIFLAVVFALIFIPFIAKVQKSSDVIFYKGYNPRSVIKDLVLRLASVLNYEQLVEALKVEFKKILATEEIEVIVFGNGAGKVDLLKSERIKSMDELSREIISTKNLVIREETRNPAIGEIMDQNKVRIAAPLIVRDRVIGMVLLGEKIEQGAYLQEDIEFLEIISSQAAAAIDNARLYQEIESLNENLQKKVEEQTADIKEKNEALEKLLVMRSEFLDIASHQLRTPVSVMKGMLSMFQEGSVPEDKKKMFLDMAFQKSIKLSEIIDDILNASEMDSKRFALNLAPIDLKAMLEDVMRDKEIAAQKKSLELKLELPAETLPKVNGDPRYLSQVFHNLINNSMQYTKEGSICVKACLENGKVAVRVSDTGLGIPASDLPKLFQKFARAENAVDAYADGSGLGLYIIKEIMERHPGGKIEIENTEEGKGTTFKVEMSVA